MRISIYSAAKYPHRTFHETFGPLPRLSHGHFARAKGFSMPQPDTHRHPSRHNRPISEQLHPAVVMAIALLGLWYLASAWMGFAADAYTAYLLVVVSGLFFVAMAIPSAIWLASHARQPRDSEQHPNTFRDWASGEFNICGAISRRRALQCKSFSRLQRWLSG
jgi:hypothetical protein